MTAADTLPRGVAAWLAAAGAGVVTAAGSGSAATSLWRASGTDGDYFVKVLVERPGAVDGHDLASFAAKPRQVGCLAAVAPAAAARHVPLLAELGGPGWAAHVMPYVAGHDLLEPARRGAPGEAAEGVARVVGALVAEGYGIAPVAVPASYVADRYVDRVMRRLPLLAQALEPSALDGDGVVVNGEHVPSLRTLLDAARALGARVAPPLLSPPVHGDLNTRNVLVRGGDFSLVDPRGSVAATDVAYDLAKLLVSATIWDASLRWGCTAARVAGGVEVRVADRAAGAYQDVARHFPSAVAAVPGIGALTGDRAPAWLAIAHALHVLAEAPCRVSAARDGDGRATPEGVEQGRAFFYAGLLFLAAALRDESAESAAAVSATLAA